MLAALKTVSQKIVSPGSQKVGQRVGLFAGAGMGYIYAGSLMTPNSLRVGNDIISKRVNSQSEFLLVPEENPKRRIDIWSCKTVAMGAVTGYVLGTVWFVSVPILVGIGFVVENDIRK